MTAYKMEFGEITAANPGAKSLLAKGTVEELCDLALKGDIYAIDFVFYAGARLAFYGAEIASQIALQNMVRPIVEKMVGVPVYFSPNKSFERHFKSGFSRFKIGSRASRIWTGRWNYTNPASRAVVSIVSLMVMAKSSATQKLETDCTEMERLCRDLPSTGPAKSRTRKRNCKLWRNAFLEFAELAYEAGFLAERITESSIFAHYRGRRTAMTGMKEKILDFFYKHLDV